MAKVHGRLVVAKTDEVYLTVSAEDSIRKELSEFFKFKVPGANFIPAVRKRFWDGYIRLFNLTTNKIYLGLYDYLKEFCDERNYTIEGYEKDTDIFTIERYEEIVKDIPLQLRDYQKEAVAFAAHNQKCILVSPTASGKSLMIYSLIRYNFLKKNKKALVIVPTTSLVEQMTKDFQDYGFRGDIAKIYGGDKGSDAPIVVTTWQSMMRMPKNFGNEFGMVIGDEAHLFAAKSLTKIMESLTEVKYKIGTTGTLQETKTHKLQLEGMFGPAYFVTTSADLMAEGTLAQLEIKALVLAYCDEERKLVSKMTYQEEMDWIVRNERRNMFINNLVKDLNGNTLVLFQFVEKHGRPLFDLLNKLDRKVFFVFGGTDALDREKVREIVEKEKDSIIVASFGTFSTGINIKRLHNVVFASPSKSRIRNLQSIGRGLRKSEDKDSVTLYDIADDLSWKKNLNYTLNHFSERINIYSTENFNYEIHSVRIPANDNNKI
jgi:superfamily II DNA or RNA helicase|tara:strand:+ start:432 stop:1898 length:1467 start_codon:yes stop_codon:yes gene_type:complete